ncbi:PEP-CTERM sorting domain-containing protein [Stieleria sp. JC731]|uniref:PEP-CTERM sorting domain-containing protein n=1 Tax=Pirellulaceae TaxID=2691357 RepID=UPI001E64AF36|nr:PEP-CTERM sorting domain-containing protein [Stieleria sp. JC731]MCC9602016.1 PEP-CTERM sorting domain-containing protein [Stieleria sp. JC731]
MLRKLSSAVFAALLFAAQAPAALISEFEPNPDGDDPASVNFELSGTAFESFDYWILSIETDSGASVGLVDRAANVTGTFDALGLAVVTIPDLENPSFTVLLTDTFTGTVGTSDVDADNDGVVDDTSFWNTVEDALSIVDRETGDAEYGAQLGGTNFQYSGAEPSLTFRDLSTGQWFAVNDPAVDEIFSATGDAYTSDDFTGGDPLLATFGALNPTLITAIPEPSSLVALGVLGAFTAVRRRRRK